MAMEASNSQQQNIARGKVCNEQIRVNIEALLQGLGTNQQNRAWGASFPKTSTDRSIQNLPVFRGKATMMGTDQPPTRKEPITRYGWMGLNCLQQPDGSWHRIQNH